MNFAVLLSVHARAFLNADNGRPQARAHMCNEGRSLQYIHEDSADQGERDKPNATLERAIASTVEVTADANYRHVIPERMYLASTESTERVSCIVCTCTLHWHWCKF